MKLIPLTQGKFAKVDDEDFEWLSKYKWYYKPSRDKTGYAVRMDNRKSGCRKQIPMHRQIMNVAERFQVDHVNLDGLDNRRLNLRICSVSQNVRNTNKRSTNKSGYKGVCWDNRHQKWHAQIEVNNKGKHLGYFNSPVDAALAYDKAARALFRDFARTNF